MQNGPYYLDMRKILHIWFSDNPNECLPALHKLRLINKKLKNPHTTFSLIYSSKCLSLEAVRDLCAFAVNLKINLFDFDTDLLESEKSLVDKQIYDLAKKEIDCCLKNKSGTMASASDLTRLLEAPVKLGHYVDLDVDVCIDKDLVFQPTKRSITINGGQIIIGPIKSPALSCHFLGVAVTSRENLTPHPDALNRLNRLKKQIIFKYNNFNLEILLQELPGCPYTLGWDNNFSDCLVRLFSLNEFDVFSFRLFLQQTNNLPPDLRLFLFEESVKAVSGSQTWYWLFHEDLERLGDISKGTFNPAAFYTLIANVNDASLAQNGLEKSILSADSPKNIEKPNVDFWKCDRSWTPLGSAALKIQSQAIDSAATTLQAACRGYLARKSIKPS